MDKQKMSGEDKAMVLVAAVIALAVVAVFAVILHFGNVSNLHFQEEFTERMTACLAEGNAPAECRVLRSVNSGD